MATLWQPLHRLACALASVAAAALSVQVTNAQPAPADLQLPARAIPVPTTVSPEMQKLIAAPPNPSAGAIPKTTDEWKERVKAGAAASLQRLPALRERMRVKVEPLTIDGVKAYSVTPDSILP